jgi:hypothetical protein
MGRSQKRSPAARAEALEARNGWLTTAGEFYVCDQRGHIGLLVDLGYDGDCDLAIEVTRWIRLSRGEWEVLTDEIPLAQREFIVEWCAVQRETLPHVLAWALGRGKK